MSISGMARIIAQALAAVVVSLTTAQGGIVTLRSHDRSIEITGQLLSFDGGSYVLRAATGDLTVQAGLVTCEGACPPRPQDGRIVISGANAFGQNLMPMLIDYFALMQDMELGRSAGDAPHEEIFVLRRADGTVYVEFLVRSGGTAGVMTGLMDGTVTLGMLSALPEIAQRQALVDTLGEVPNTPTEFAVALDGLAFVVSPQNPLKALSMDQIAGIYAGTITNWAQLGGPDHAITPYMLDRDMGEGGFFTETFLRARGLVYGATIQEVGDTETLNRRLMADPFGIGFTGVGNVDGPRILSLRGACGILSRPDGFGVAAQEYPLSNRLYLVDSGVARSAAMQDFLDFIQTEAAQTAVYNAGYIDDRITRQSVAAQGRRMQNMILEPAVQGSGDIRALAGDLQTASRLSTTFRFQYGYADFDARSSHDLANLAAYLGQMDMTGREVLVLGFTDSEGTARTNTVLSKRRADFVAAELHKALGDRGNSIHITAKGYGESSPLACNDTPRGRDINRRVEVWIRDRS